MLQKTLLCSTTITCDHQQLDVSNFRYCTAVSLLYYFPLATRRFVVTAIETEISYSYRITKILSNRKIEKAATDIINHNNNNIHYVVCKFDYF